jgi:formylglycine-generating enzyme required for sulfatase activity
MKKLKNIVLIVFALSLTALIFSCGKKTTEPEIPSLVETVRVPGGTFTMGRTKGDGPNYELPTHSVTLSSFYIGKYQVTQGEYEAIMGSNPSHSYSVGNKYPVYYVSWYDAIKFCNLCSMREKLVPVYSIAGSTNPDSWGEVPSTSDDDSTWAAAVCNWNANGYRLPTEAEWEYAARGATNNPDYLYSGSDNARDVAWYNENASTMFHVGTRAPNGLGIYDMSGNVFEWCWDWYDSSYYSSSPSNNPRGPESGSDRMIRGGCWSLNDRYCRVSNRSDDNPAYKNSMIGFRVCRSAK